jgi:hypothetical protein
MRLLPAVSPALARAVWEGMALPSTRRVARKFRQAGRAVSHETVRRWRANGWCPLASEQHPLDVARAVLDDAIPVLTCDPLTTAESFVGASNRAEALDHLSDGRTVTEGVSPARDCDHCDRRCPDPPCSPAADSSDRDRHPASRAGQVFSGCRCRIRAGGNDASGESQERGEVTDRATKIGRSHSSTVRRMPITTHPRAISRIKGTPAVEIGWMHLMPRPRSRRRSSATASPMASSRSSWRQGG